MIRGTTPDFVLIIDGYDLTDKTVYVTIKQACIMITKTGDVLSVTHDESGSAVAFSLTQQDTLALHTGSAKIQVRFINSAGKAWATYKATVEVESVLLNEVIEYAGD